MSRNFLFILIFSLLFSACSNTDNVPSVGFLDVAEDATLAKARKGFFDAMRQQGFSEQQKSLRIYEANAQGDIAMLNQSCDYLIAKNPDVIAANATLSTITAVKRTKTIPVCMMVAPSPELAGLKSERGMAPANLFGVYETLSYIDTSVAIIQQFFPQAKIIGTIYNSSEPQSANALNRLQLAAQRLGLSIIPMPVTTSSETQLVAQALVAKKPDVFFALPDNVIFASFETIAKVCNDAHIPVFTSEAGLVSRGAIASYGADFYQWGFQAGLQAASYLKSGRKTIPHPEEVKTRNFVYNPKAAEQYHLIFPDKFKKADE